MRTRAQLSALQVAQRRKLVRGAFAAPAIMTVCTGSAFAAASALKPLERQCATPVYQVWTAAPDSWLRVQCFLDPATNTYYVSGADLHNGYKRANNSVCVASNMYRQVTFPHSAGAMGSSDCSLPSGATRCARYVGVTFSSTGNVVCVGQGSGTGYSHVSLNSWTSVAPHI